MNIIIAGAGEVGHYVARKLSNEEHDILVIDENPDSLKDIDSAYDIMTYAGSPMSPKDLQNCNVKNCDIFLAVTPYESQNITASMIAHNLGAHKTVARVNSSEYLSDKNKQLFAKMGVDKLIYPENLAAIETVEALKRGWIREYRSFESGSLVLICVKVRQDATIIDIPFKTGFFNDAKYRVVAIRRHGETIIPGGNDEIKADDLVYFICAKENMEAVRVAANKKRIDIKNVIIMGGSLIARKTLQYLPDNISVKIIEKDKERCYRLADEVDCLVINGDGRDLDLLKDEGIEDTDAFVALTESADTNILACLTAKRLGIRKTIAQIENIDYFDMANNLDIGTIINKKLIAASNLYQQILDENTYNVQCLTYSNAMIIEFLAKAGNKITKGKVRDIRLPHDVNIGGVIRNGKGSLVNGNTQIEAGDRVVIFCKASSIQKLAKFFE